jgi:ubiquitin-conjugating enzyme E2 Z
MSKQTVSTISKSTIQRLIRDVKQIIKEPLHDNGIYYQHDEEDMMKGYAMIIGAKDTPYYGGFYMFEFSFPTNYPHSPPVVTYLTNGDGIRFNPNLYKNGKVCVSVLNTWKGDQWTSCQNISTILLALCMVLCDKPLLNEPGITEKHKDFKRYTSIIEFKSIEIAMLNMLNKKEGYYLNKFDRFFPHMKEYFEKNSEDLKKYLLGLWSKSEPGSVIISTSLYSMRVTINYNKLVRYFESTITTFTGINLDDKSYTLDDILSLDENIVVSAKPKRLKKVKETTDK